MPAIALRRSYASRLPFITLKLNGLGEHTFLVDSGAEKSSLIPELIEQYRVCERGWINGATGLCPGETVAVTFNLLHKKLTKVLKETANLKLMERKLGFRISGLLGQDLLSQFSVYAFDNKAGLFRFEV